MINPTAKLSVLFHVSTFSKIAFEFSVAYFPKNTAIVSLINFPIKNAGIILIGLTFAIPAARKSGVVGSGINE